MSSIHLKGHQPSLSPSISAKANVYRAKVKLDPEWFLLVLLGIFMSLSLPSVTFPCGLAMIAAALSTTSAHGRYQGKGILLSGHWKGHVFPVLSGCLFHPIPVEGQRNPA